RSPKTSSTEFSSTITVLTTPLDNCYNRLNFRSTAGYWKLYSAKSIAEDKDSTIFVFDRKNNVKASSRLGRSNRLTLIDLIRYDISQLLSLTHPRILKVLHELEEDKEMITFATEHIQANLEVVMIQDEIGRLEMKLGILQSTLW
ncbi:unnamed protein product, partial [Onchocerca ochengi]|uniref:Protein kinase domain-containing protein n=1 Tax=Onchocerca ochengi TaxID=42157 RepID=A0A182ERT0_ONCOC